MEALLDFYYVSKVRETNPKGTKHEIKSQFPNQQTLEKIDQNPRQIGFKTAD